MLPPSNQEPVSLLKVLSANNAIGGGTSITTEHDSPSSSSSNPNTIKHHHAIGASRRSSFSLHKQHSDESFRSLNSSTVVDNNTPTRNIVNQALEVMSNSPLKDAILIAQQDQQEQSEESTGEDDAPTENSSSDNDNDNDNDEPTRAAPEPPSSIGNLTAQPSFRKIAKKRRTARGRSFHHTKSSKESLRRAQESLRKDYERLKINDQQEQDQQNDQQQQQRQPELQSVRDSTTEEDSNPYGYGDPDSSTSTRSSTDPEPEPVDYGYGDPAATQPQQPVDYGYGDPVATQPQQPVDYGYGDPVATQPQQPRRGGRARRRNSVTKFSADAANVVAAKAAAERIIRLKPSLTSLSRGGSMTPTRQRQRQQQQQRSKGLQSRGIVSTGTIGTIAAMRTMLQQQHLQQEQNEEQQHEDQNKNNVVDRVVPDRTATPQRSCRCPRDTFRNRDSFTKHSSELQGTAESQQPQQDDSSSSLQIISSGNCPLQLTSGFFSSDPKPKSIFRKNSSRSINTPVRTESWPSNDNSYSTVYNDDDDDDANSLASGMESLCSMRDGSYRLDNNFRNTDFPPVQPPRPLASPLIQPSPSSTSKSISRLTSPDCPIHFSGGRISTGETNSRKPTEISWSNESNNDGVDNVCTSRERMKSGVGKFPFPPLTSVTTSKSCMPAPVNRTPSYTGSSRQEC